MYVLYSCAGKEAVRPKGSPKGLKDLGTFHSDLETEYRRFLAAKLSVLQNWRIRKRRPESWRGARCNAP
jgi:hypothetical protein